MNEKVSRKQVDAWLEANRPHIKTAVVNGNKGVYDDRQGLAFSFETRGKTWKQVLESFTLTA